MTPITQPSTPQPETSQQTAFLTLNAAIQRLAVRRERQADPHGRQELRSNVNAALEAYRNYMRVAAA